MLLTAGGVEMSDISQLSSPSPKKPLTPFRAAHGVVKSLSVLVGLPLTVVSLMSLIGLATDNFWIRLVPAIIVALGAPLLLVDRLLPDDEAAMKSAQGLTTDTLALVWLGFAVLFIGVGQPLTGALLVAEADRYAGSGVEPVAFGLYWLAGATGNEDVEGETTALTQRADAGPAIADAALATSETGPDGAAPDSGNRDAAVDAAQEEPTKGVVNAQELTPTELFRKAAPAVVTISVKTGHGEGGGSGFFIDHEGTIATNSHVVHDAVGVTIKMMDGSVASGVELLAENEDDDLALLKVKVDSRTIALTLTDSDDVQVGERIICIGNPLGLEHTLSDGLVSSRRTYQGKNWVQMTAPISPGNSGGPVLNMRGEVIGIATASIQQFLGRAQNLNLAVPVNVLKRMISDEYPDSKKLGPGPRGPSTW